MQVEVIAATENPIDVISVSAGCCYGKSDASPKRAESCFKAGHLSVFEHVSVTLRVEGISRACMAQLTRHRLVSFCVESQRYNKYDLSGAGWYVTPPTFAGHIPLSFTAYMERCAEKYRHALECGIKPEDARYLLPEATKTNLVMSCNARELFHILDMRLDKSAQWEIRELAAAIMAAIAAEGGQWKDIIDLREARE